MASRYFFPLFSDVRQLHRFHFPIFRKFLFPYQDYLWERHGLQLTNNPDTFPFRPLVGVLALPDDEMPDTLCSGLFFINALSTPEGMEKVGETLDFQLLLPNFPLTHYDSAVYAWTTDPKILQGVHTQILLTNNEWSERIACERDASPDLSRKSLTTLEDKLNAWKETTDPRQGIQLVYYERNNAIEFHLRHGELARPDSSTTSRSQTKRTVHRPTRIDLLVLDPNERLLQIHSNSVDVKGEYCFLFGKYCFGNPNHFKFSNSTGYYTLDPLWEQGRNALICSDVQGLNRIRLWELHAECYDQGQSQCMQVFKAKSKCLFEEKGSLDRFVDKEAKLVLASFLVDVAGHEKPQYLNIYTPNLLRFKRGSGFDEPITNWIRKRTFAR